MSWLDYCNSLSAALPQTTLAERTLPRASMIGIAYRRFVQLSRLWSSNDYDTLIDRSIDWWIDWLIDWLIDVFSVRLMTDRFVAFLLQFVVGWFNYSRMNKLAVWCLEGWCAHSATVFAGIHSVCDCVTLWAKLFIYKIPPPKNFGAEAIIFSDMPVRECVC